MRILVVNAGSSSLKLRVVDRDGGIAASRDLPALDVDDEGSSRDLEAAIHDLTTAAAVDAVGHRVVHGGTELTSAIVIDDDLVARVAALSDMAPLHQPRCVAGIAAARRALPAVPHVACFDTAFHATIPAAAATYALPAAWRARWPLRRFGFHGLSHAWAARRAAELLERPVETLRLVTCHLGAGASLAAVDEGRSVDTTMGFTPLEGLVMATRAGSVDPGLVLWLQQRGGLTTEAVADGLEHGAGLAGLAGTADMREVVAAVERGDAAATLARDVYVHRLRGAIAAMVASLGGLDALVFTGGVGEHAPTIRAATVNGLGLLGLNMDPRRNAAAAHDLRVDAGPGPAVLVVESREDLEIAREVRSLLA